MADELDRLERQSATEDIQVRTYPERTEVTLVYHHEEDQQ